MYDSDGSYSDINMVRLCKLSIFLYKADVLLHKPDNRTSAQLFSAEWVSVWKELPAAIYKFRTTKYTGDNDGSQDSEKQITRNMAFDCLSRLQALDRPEESKYKRYQDWLKSFDPDDTIFPDRLYEELAWFTSGNLSSSRDSTARPVRPPDYSQRASIKRRT